MLFALLWFAVILVMRMGVSCASRLPCLMFSCATPLTPSLSAKCDNCSQCHTDARRFCLKGNGECECADSIPKSCVPKSGNNSVEICYVPPTSMLRMPDMNTDDDNSITVEIDRFWEQEDEALHFRNLTLNALFVVKDLIDCTDHGNFSRAKVIEGNACFTKYRIPLPSIDYASDDDYYYDDHQNPMIQFDRQIFEESHPVTFWYEVRARKLFRLPINVTVFFQYPVKSSNITYTIPFTGGAPTVRSTSNLALMLFGGYQSPSSEKAQDSNRLNMTDPESDLQEYSTNEQKVPILIGIVAVIFLLLFFTGLIICLCCINRRDRKYIDISL